MGRADEFEQVLDGFRTASAARRHEAFRAVVARVWNNGEALDGADSAAEVLVTALGAAAEEDRPGLVLLLGLLADSTGPHAAGAVAAVRTGLASYLELLAPDAGRALTQALVFLLTHFTEDRDSVLAAAGAAGLDAADLSRLDRALQQPQLKDPVIGRVWPSPALWALTDAEKAGDRQWTTMMTPEQITAMWQGDTRTLIAYCGARAVAAVDGAVPPAPSAPTATTAGAVAGSDAGSDSASGAARDVLGGHAGVLACPVCHGPLTATADGCRCDTCASDLPVQDGLLDLSAGAGEGMDTIVLKDPVHVPRYEFVLRPAFLEIMGGNWSGEVGTGDEDAYLTDHLRPVDGPVLDLAAGSGRWTGHISSLVGADRTIALDLSAPMLRSLHGDHPDVFTVRGSALNLPFGDASLGAVNCWNALQALPEPASVIAEIGRCLKPGGTFTLLTFSPAADPLARHFQQRHEQPLRVGLFEPGQLQEWLAKAGLAVRDLRTPGSFLFVTAVREDAPGTD